MSQALLVSPSCGRRTRSIYHSGKAVLQTDNLATVVIWCCDTVHWVHIADWVPCERPLICAVREIGFSRLQKLISPTSKSLPTLTFTPISYSYMYSQTFTFRYMKRFKILNNRIGLYDLPYISKIATVVGYLVNFQAEKL